MKGEFPVSNRIFRESLNEKVQVEETSERGEGRGRGFHSVERALSRVSIYVCMLYIWITGFPLSFH